MDILAKIKKHLPSIDEKLIVGVSGGVDSMVLLDLLHKTGHNLVVCHINYNLRKNSAYDYALIKKYCDEKNIEIKYFEVKNSITGNTQGEARKIRYKFFKEIADAESTSRVVIAHHQDDNIETYLLQKQRNIIIEHYGLKYSREVFSMSILRPMLGIFKNQIIKYAKENNIEWNEDQTNHENNYQRNKIRNTLLAQASLIKKTKILLDIYLKNKKTKILFNIVQKRMDEYIVDNRISGEIFNLPKTQSTIIIYLYLKVNRYPISRINKKIINEILDFHQKTKKPVALLDLAKEFKLKKQHNWYYVTKEKSWKKEEA